MAFIIIINVIITVVVIIIRVTMIITALFSAEVTFLFHSKQQ